MAVNRYFNQTTYRPEQELLQDLTDEAIGIHGHNVHYVMRDDVAVDRLFGEDPISTYTRAFEIEMYVKSFSQFGGNGDFISKFGLHIEDQCVFSVSVRRFNEECNGAISRPREGDYIFIQLTPDNTHLAEGESADLPHRIVFEIRKVNEKENLFPLGEHYTYELHTEQVQYSHERVETGVEPVDGVLEKETYTLAISLGDGDGVYANDEIVYQGLSFMAAVATGKVAKYDANTATLHVRDITGAFGNTLPIVGVTSDASWTPAQTPSTAPTVNDRIADNEVLDTSHETVIVNRGNNPRLN